MPRIAVCEDDLKEQKRFKQILWETSFFNKFDMSFFVNGKELFDKLNEGIRYDIIFLDVDMPIMGGIQTGMEIRKVDPQAIIIFVTSYPEYAIDAFDCNAFNYLLKNSSKEQYNSILSKAYNKYESNHQTYTISTKEGVETLNLHDIYFIECCRKHLYFHTQNKVFITKKTLTEVYNKLGTFGFYQVHQGYIVNFEKVVSINNNDIILDNSEKVMISVRKRVEVLKAYAKYLQRCL